MVQLFISQMKLKQKDFRLWSCNSAVFSQNTVPGIDSTLCLVEVDVPGIVSFLEIATENASFYWVLGS